MCTNNVLINIQTGQWKTFAESEYLNQRTLFFEEVKLAFKLLFCVIFLHESTHSMCFCISLTVGHVFSLLSSINHSLYSQIKHSVCSQRLILWTDNLAYFFLLPNKETLIAAHSWPVMMVLHNHIISVHLWHPTLYYVLVIICSSGQTDANPHSYSTTGTSTKY